MEIITRRQAIERGLNKYFTGVPCKWGHVCERYTQMCACLDCLHPKLTTSESREERRRIAIERLKVYTDRRFAKARLDRLRLAVYTPNLKCIREFIYSLVVAKEPSLTPADILTKFKYQERGPNTFLHTFKLFREDFNAVIQLNEALHPRVAVSAPQPVPQFNAGDGSWPEGDPS